MCMYYIAVFSSDSARDNDYGCSFSSVSYIGFILIFVNTIINVSINVKYGILKYYFIKWCTKYLTIFLFERSPIATTTTITIITTTIITITTMIITTTTTKACNRIWEEVFHIMVRIPATNSWVLQSHKVSSKSDQKQKKIINRTFFVNKQLTLFFNYLKKSSLNFAQNFRECSFNLAGSESGEKSRRAQFFVYISQLFVYKTRLWT